MRKNNIEKIIADTIESLDGAKRAEPKPFLLTRVMAAINSRPATQNIWLRTAAFISKPGIAVAAILVILTLNISIFVINKNDTEITGAVQNNTILKDEFAINAGTIYDIENPEQ